MDSLDRRLSARLWLSLSRSLSNTDTLFGRQAFTKWENVRVNAINAVYMIDLESSDRDLDCHLQ